jgi:hypothetical protein
MIKVFTHTSTMIPARLLAVELTALGRRTEAVANPLHIMSDDTVINYGAVIRTNAINSPQFIGVCGNKLNFSHVLGENGFNTPEYKGTNVIPTSYPVVVRSTLHGQGGEGISFANNLLEFNRLMRPGYYWTKFYNCSFELRAHIMGGEVKRIFKKVKEEEDNFPIRNSQHDYHYSLRDINNYPKVLQIVEQLSEIFGIDNFYALDLGYEDSTKSYVIYEANSAPGLNSNTAKLYANYLFKRLH